MRARLQKKRDATPNKNKPRYVRWMNLNSGGAPPVVTEQKTEIALNKLTLTRNRTT